MTAKLLECMPSRSTAVLYGSLNEVATEGFDPLLLIGRSYTVEGFILGEFIKQMGVVQLVKTIWKVRSLMGDETLQSKVAKCIKFSEF